MTDLDVDTRSDVYSLGVLLYELLTGTTPFDKDKLAEVGDDEIRRIIREDEPPRPSERVSTLNAERLSTVSEKRGVEPRRLKELVWGELDWIVMKALEKELPRRYESASALAADIERYLSGEPVAACPPSVSYKFRKFARRNKAALSAGVLVLATLVLGLLATSWQAVRATNALKEKEAALNTASANLRKANDEQRRAETNYWGFSAGMAMIRFLLRARRELFSTWS